MSNKAPWFRLFGDRWQSETRGLTLQERAIYIDLLVEMHRREEPLSDDWLDQIRSIMRARPTTFDPAIERLVALGLFVRVDGGLWSTLMEGEIENRGSRTEWARQNSAKSRRTLEKSRSNPAENLKNLPQKSKQNQRSGAAMEIKRQIHREAPTGASQNVDTENEFGSSTSGPPPADAGRSMLAIDEANMAFEEAFRELRTQSHEGHFDSDEEIADEDMDEEMRKAWRDVVKAWDDGCDEDERQIKRDKQK